MSTLCRQDRKNPAGEKGLSAEALPAFPSGNAGPQEKILRTVTLRGALSFCVEGNYCLLTVNVGVFQDSRFFVEKI